MRYNKTSKEMPKSPLHVGLVTPCWPALDNKLKGVK